MNLKKLIEQKGLTQMDIGRELWPASKVDTQKINAWKLVNGKTKTLSLEWIDSLCGLLDISPNELFELGND